MHLTRLSLADFRSYPTAEVPLAAGVSVFVGPNGQGKTNLVEAVGFLASLDSHRVATTAPLVRAGAERAVVRAGLHRDGRDLLLEVEITPGRALRARLNASGLPRAREIIGVLRVVTFAPEDVALVRGDPGERRRFVDDVMTQRAPRLAGIRSDYDRVLRQRTALLKTAQAARRAGDLSTLDAWDAHLARYGGEIMRARLDLVRALAPRAGRAYAQVSDGKGPLVMTYRSSLPEPAADTARSRSASADADADPGAEIGPGWVGASAGELADALLVELGRRRQEEIDRGACLVGPHRDDLVLHIGELPARGYASHGETWSAALALRLASYHLMREEDAEPVLVLDDVFAELDTARRDRLAAMVGDAEQVLVTAAVPADVPAGLAGRRYDVTGGGVRGVG